MRKQVFLFNTLLMAIVAINAISVFTFYTAFCKGTTDVLSDLLFTNPYFLIFVVLIIALLFVFGKLRGRNKIFYFSSLMVLSFALIAKIYIVLFTCYAF